VSAAERVSDCGEGVQCPNERKPIFFMQGDVVTIRASLKSTWPAVHRSRIGQAGSGRKRSNLLTERGRIRRRL
jgi:hypothetical protein